MLSDGEFRNGEFRNGEFRNGEFRNGAFRVVDSHGAAVEFGCGRDS